MSPLNRHPLFAALCLAVIIAFGSSAAAQDALRLWKPYTPESFGGGRRTNDGIYASLSGVYWSISAPRGGYIGATTASGNEVIRFVLGNDGATVGHYQTNTLTAAMMGTSSSIGTRFELGNRIGHSGWLASGFALPTQNYSLHQNNASFTMRDEGNIRFNPSVFMQSGSSSGTGGTGGTGGTTGGTSGSGIEHIFVWNPGTHSYFNSQGKLPYGDPNYHYLVTQKQTITNKEGKTEEIDVPNTIPGIGYLWGWYEVTAPASSGGNDDGTGNGNGTGTGTGTGNNNNSGATFAVLAPVPITLRNVTIEARSKIQSGEIMYTYRPHPFSWGNIECLGGLRYFDFDDRFNFGSGPKTQTSSDTGGGTDDGTGGGTDDGTGDDAAAAEEDTGPSVFSAISALNFQTRVQNRIFGPQIGFKLNRQNARWTFFLDSRLMIGLNTQSIRLSGDLVYGGTETAATGGTGGGTDDGTGTGTGGTTTGTESNVTLIAVDKGLTDFGHKQNKCYVTPIAQLRFGADWQWTESVSFFGAFDTMYANNIARGYRVPDYVVKPGVLFGIRGSDRNTSVMMYGVEAGIKVRR